jgi:hypothetical protein
MNAPVKPLEPIDTAALRQSYLDEIDAAPDMAAVRRVQRKMQGDKRIHHAIAHAINEHIRARAIAPSAPAPATLGAGAAPEENRAVGATHASPIPAKVKK